MADKSGEKSPIPPVKKDDAEDVSWALQTAETVWGRGDHADALKWIRRAAEAASEAELDDRALELAKAAADLATRIGPLQTSPPPPAAPPQRPLTSPPPPPPPPARDTSRPPPPPPAAATRPSTSPPPMRPPAPGAAPIPKQPPAAGRPATPVAAPQKLTAARPATPARAPMPAARPAPQAVLPKASAKGPESRRGRRSSANLNDDAKRAATLAAKEITATFTNIVDPEVTQQVEIPIQPEPRRRGRASRPAAEEVTPVPAPAIIAAPPPLPATTEEMDAWPTQSLVGDEMDAATDEKTRIGAPAYAETAKRGNDLVAPRDPAPELRMSQAIRVVVWRSPDGVHVAPAGTTISAISVEAMLVSLDPAADLAAWLRQK